MDRDETLRRAELLLRQGRPDAAAEEYARVAAANPGDLATANALGDLYIRMQRPDLAVPVYLRVADIYLREGFFAKAAAFYKKVLKYEPASASVLVKLAEACRAQGLRVEARGYLQAALQQQHRQNDPGDVDELLVRLADNDASDLDSAVAAAPARARRRGVEAIPSLQATVSALETAGRLTDAEPLRRLIAILTPVSGDGADRSTPLGLALGAGHRGESQADGAAARTPLEGLASSPFSEGHAPFGTVESAPQAAAGGDRASTEPGHPGDAEAHRALEAAFARLRRDEPPEREPGASRLALAETYLAAGLDAEALPLLEASAADPATMDRAAFLMAGVCERRGRLADAARWMAAALDSGLPDADARRVALQRLGDLYERLREPARALEAWREARGLAVGSNELDERIARVSAQLHAANDSPPGSVRVVPEAGAGSPEPESGGGPFTR